MSSLEGSECERPDEDGSRGVGSVGGITFEPLAQASPLTWLTDPVKDVAKNQYDRKRTK